ncbi:thioredoxin [Litoreibacter ponti]|uniref:Thioredoxin n=1 Tax=Litoreibacter ponti TaxID=1510457 RepID=A0A2T6BPN1_9RHOB|nr:thioredoxin family protein [Litoreibacter ponti]PTX58040.1 thioredoxin [Litoreibacter ponti]
MNRRAFLMTTAALGLAPMAALAGGLTTIDYDRTDPIKAALAEGKTVFVDYAADWCSTCRKQERVINALRAENPEYDANIVFVRVDWDDFGNSPVARDRNIPRRSTLIVLKGNDELGRVVAGTSTAQIKELMDRALDAAQTA